MPIRQITLRKPQQQAGGIRTIGLAGGGMPQFEAEPELQRQPSVLAQTAGAVGREILGETAGLARGVVTKAYLPETIYQTTRGLGQGILGFGADIYSRMAEAAKQFVGTGTIDPAAMSAAGEKAAEELSYEVTDPGAQAALQFVSALPTGIKMIGHAPADYLESEYPGRFPNLVAALKTGGDIGELLAFGKVFHSLKFRGKEARPPFEGVPAEELKLDIGLAADMKRRAELAGLRERKALPPGQGFREAGQYERWSPDVAAEAAGLRRPALPPPEGIVAGEGFVMQPPTRQVKLRKAEPGYAALPEQAVPADVTYLAKAKGKAPVLFRLGDAVELKPPARKVKEQKPAVTLKDMDRTKAEQAALKARKAPKKAEKPSKADKQSAELARLRKEQGIELKYPAEVISKKQRDAYLKKLGRPLHPKQNQIDFLNKRIATVEKNLGSESAKVKELKNLRDKIETNKLWIKNMEELTARPELKIVPKEAEKPPAVKPKAKAATIAGEKVELLEKVTADNVDYELWRGDKNYIIRVYDIDGKEFVGLHKYPLSAEKKARARFDEAVRYVKAGKKGMPSLIQAKAEKPTKEPLKLTPDEPKKARAAKPTEGDALATKVGDLVYAGTQQIKSGTGYSFRSTLTNGNFTIKELSEKALREARQKHYDAWGIGKPKGPTVEFLGFQSMYEATLKAVKKIRTKKTPTAISPEWPKADMGRYEKGTIIKHRKKGKDAITGEDLYAPPLYEMEERIMKTTKEPARTITSELNMQTSNRTFDQLGPEAKELVYWPMVEGYKRITLERKLIDKRVKALDRGMSHKNWINVGVYGIAQQKGGRTRLKNMGFPEKKIPTKLKPNEEVAYKALRREFEIFFNRANKARRLSGKQSFAKQPNYFTFMHDAPLLERMGFSLGEGKMSILNEQFLRLNTTPFRYAKARAKLGQYPMELNAKEIFRRYAEVATKHIHLSPHIAKGRELLNTFGTKKAGTRWKLEEEAPRAAKFVQDWLNHQAGQIPVGILGKQMDSILMTVNQNLAFAVLSANARSALIQPTAILHAAVELGPKYTMKGAASIMHPVHSLRNHREALLKSNHLIGRAYDVSVTDALQGIRRGKLGQVKKAAAQIGLKPLQLLDMETAIATWQGAYMKAKEVNGLKEFDAIRYADDVVIRTQASAMPTDIAPIQRTAMGKTLTLFNTFVINEWGWITGDVLGIRNAKMTNTAAFKKTLGLIVGATIVNVIYEDFMGISSPYPGPIRAFKEAVEKGEGYPSASLDALRELAEIVPVVGGALRYGSHPAGAAAQFAYEVVEKIAGKPWAKPWLEIGGKAAGVVGTTQVGKIVRGKKRGETPWGQVVGTYTPKPKRKGGGLTGGLGGALGGGLGGGL